MNKGRFEKLKESISNDSKLILNEIWNYNFKSDRKCILTSSLSYKFGKKTVYNSLSSLNTSVLKEFSDNGRKRCYLTFLGMLLTSEGEQSIDLFLKYLSFIQNNLRNNFEFSEIKSEEVYENCNFSEEQQKIFTKLLWVSHFTDGGGGGGTNWKFGIPSYMENELALEENIEEFFFRYVFEYNNESLPSLYEEREGRLIANNEKSPFSFITDNKLRTLIEKDWAEVTSIFYVRAWKSCVLLCGSILEGILINELNKNLQAANTEYQTRRSKNAPNLDKWDLVDLVEVANKLNVFPKGTFHLTHAIREFRNLIHPGKQLREHLEITEEQAHIAFNTIKDLQKEKNK